MTVSEKNAVGDYPLHIAIQQHLSLEIIELLASIDPKILTTQNDIGDYPIQTAIKSHLDVNIITKVLTNGDVFTMKNKASCMPIHLALNHKSSFDFISKFIQSCPSSLNEKDGLGNYPLHIAIINKLSLHILQYLISEEPKILNEKDAYGDYPLHCAIINKLPFESISYIITSQSNILHERDFFSNFPLHNAIIHKLSYDIITIIISFAPNILLSTNQNHEFPLMLLDQSLCDDIFEYIFANHSSVMRLCNDHNDTFLHMALRCKFSVKKLLQLISSFPENALIINNSSSTPLHIAAKYNISVDVMKELITLLPSSCMGQDKDGNMPLHIALVHTCSKESILTIIKNGPDSCKFYHNFNTDVLNDEFPLHLACIYRADVEVIKDILHRHLTVTERVNKQGNCPLHLAILHGLSFDCVHTLIAAKPSACLKSNHDQYIPLHLAIMNHAIDDIILGLLSPSPLEISLKVTSDGNNALHLALYHGSSIIVVEQILLSYSRGYLMKNRFGKTPFDMGLDGKSASSDVMKLMLFLDLPIDMADNSPKDHYFSWTSFLDGTRAYLDIHIVINIVQEVFKKYSSAVDALCYCKDILGKSAIQYRWHRHV